MISGRLLRCLLVLAGSAVVCHGINMEFCSRDLCSCPQPNGDVGDAVKVDDGSSLGCLCACGREEGSECTSDDHCAQGTSCSYGKDLAKTGAKQLCTNKCSMTKCDQYSRCDLDDNRQPICSCRSFDCSASGGPSVNAVRGNDQQVFTTECDRVNTNCQLQMNNAASPLWLPTQ